MRLRSHIALIERVQHGMTGTVGCRARTLHGLFTKVGGMPAKRPLINRAIGITIERHAEMLQLIDDLGRFATHELNRILITEIIAALDSVKHVPVPAVFGHVAERSTDTTLRRHRMGACRKNFGEHGHIETGFGELQRRAHTRTAGTDDNSIEATRRNAGFDGCHDYTLQRI